MRLSKKIVGLLLVLAFFSISTVYAAMDASTLNTFGAIWEAITESDSKVAILEAKIAELEAKVAELEESGGQAAIALSTADFDSRWRTISVGSLKKIKHNLGTKKLFVYIIGREFSEGTWTVHQKSYGGDTYSIYDSAGSRNIFYEFGIYWLATGPNAIYVRRVSSDYKWDQIRVYIWRLS